jgi:hypothetical protein
MKAWHYIVLVGGLCVFAAGCAQDAADQNTNEPNAAEVQQMHSEATGAAGETTSQ